MRKPALRQISESKPKKDLYLLTVYVRKVIGLKNVEILNYSDAFVQVEFRGKFYETPIVSNNLEPWFN
jgi:Ca2+-dependent lipid-binding protein